MLTSLDDNIFHYSFERLNLIWQFEYCVGLLDNSRIANSWTGHLADWSTPELDNSWTGQLANTDYVEIK